ncbi:unnamed protein product [Closterium sp. NIES-65]|nr:unnamed protein product [Closterium sp. NIES-65]
MRPPWLGSSPPAGAGSPFSTSSPSNVILTTGRHGGSNGGFGGGLFNSLWAYARPGRWWLAILIICAFQGVLLWHWSNTSAIVFPDQKSASGAAIGGKGGSLNRQRLGDAAAAAAAASAFRRHLIIESQEQTQDVSNLRSLSYNPTTASLSAAALEELVRKVAENVSQRIESHEAVLVNLGIKLLNREQQLSKIDKHFLDAALLNRTLVFPSHGPGVDYDYERLLDMEAPRRCFGNQTFLTLDEYAAIQEAKVGTVGCARVGSGEKPGRGLQDAAVLVSEWHAGVPITPGPECPEDFWTAAEVVVSSRVVFPSHGPGVDYDYERLLDMEAPRRCFGNQTFLTLDEYAAIQEAKVGTVLLWEGVQRLGAVGRCAEVFRTAAVSVVSSRVVFPSHGPGVDYDYERLLDMEAPRRCFGNQTFLTLDEYAAIQEAKRLLDMEAPRRCFGNQTFLTLDEYAAIQEAKVGRYGGVCAKVERWEGVPGLGAVGRAGVDYVYERLLDMEAPRRCFGNQTFLTLDEYAAIQEAKNPKRRKSAPVMVVDVFICHVHHYQTERECGYIRQRYQQLHIHFAKTVIPEKRTPSPWFKYPSKEFISLFNYDDSVIAFGNMFGVSGQDLRFHHARPLVVLPGCKYYIMPSPMVRQAAAGFINSYIGSSTSSSDNSNAGGDAAGGGVRAAGDGGAGGTGGGGFMALHMRRGDFYQHCVNMKGHSKFACYHPIRQLAACVARRLDENPGVRAIYLSTNGDDDEVRMFREFLAFERARPRKYVVNGTTEDGRVGSVVRVRGGRSGLFSSEPVPVVRMSIKSLETQPWAEPLVQAGAHNDSVVISYVEKAICVMSNVFFGTYGSTFTGDIVRLRDWLYLNSCNDGMICPETDQAELITPFES